MTHPTEVREKAENPLLNLVFNIVLPVAILNQVSKWSHPSAPLIALLAALALPIGYGFYDYLKRKKSNYISVLGIVNVAFTGGFALLKLDGPWFAVKEALFPFIVGVAVFISVLIDKPFLRTLFWNENVFRVRRIEERLEGADGQSALHILFRQATLLFSLSFFLSAILNFVLARQIFTTIDVALPEIERSQILNEQISAMTWKGYIVIAIPMMVIMGLVLWFMLNRLKKLSGLTLEEILPEQPAKT